MFELRTQLLNPIPFLDISLGIILPASVYLWSMAFQSILTRLILWLTPANLTISFVVYWTVWIVYARFFHPLSKVPGPFAASISRAWIPWQVLRGDIEHTQRKFHDKYGPLMRIAPNEIACSDPEAIKLIYGTKDPWIKTDFYEPWHNAGVNPIPDHFSGRDEKLHAARRKTVNHVYCLPNVLQSEKYIDECSDMFIQRMGEYSDAEKPVNLGEWLQMYAFDIIGEIFFGKMFGFMEGRHDHAGYIKSLDTLMPAMVVSATSASYTRPFILGSAVLSSAGRDALRALEHIGNAARSSVVQRFEEIEAGRDTRRDLLAQFISIQHEKSKDVVFTVQDIQQECYAAFFAGSDTTAIALRSVFYYLMKNPVAYEKVQKEVDEATANGSLGNPAKYTEVMKLPYLCACVKEAMRLHPSVAFTMPRIVPDGGRVICGQLIPAGYNIGLNGAVIHYNKEIFGQDSYDFNPSRWIEGDATDMDKYMITFGAGTRMCIGKNISIVEIHKLVPQVLRNFTLKQSNPGKSWKTMNQWFNKQTGLHVNLTRR